MVVSIGFVCCAAALEKFSRVERGWEIPSPLAASGFCQMMGRCGDVVMFSGVVVAAGSSWDLGWGHECRRLQKVKLNL